MPDSRQAFDTPPVALDHLPDVLAGLSALFADLRAADLRLSHRGDRDFALLLPHWSASPHCDEARVRHLQTRLAESLGSHAARPYDPHSRMPRSVNFETLEPLAGIAARAIALLCRPRLDPAEEGLRLALIDMERAGAETLAADTLRRARDPAYMIGQDAAAGRRFAVLRLSNDSERGATLNGLRAVEGPRLPLLARCETPGGTIWLDEDQHTEPARRGTLGQILTGLRLAGLLAPDEELLLCRVPESDLWLIRLAAAAPFAPPDEITDAQEPPQPATVVTLQLIPEAAAREALAARVIEAQFPIGYQVRLETVPARIGDEASIEHLTERIHELTAEIETIRALAAPQMRLLRFSDRQLPALVDGLRRMPPSMQTQDALTFASAHAAGRVGPAHFVLYDPGRVSFDGRLPEYYWRGETDDHPISYWLDPHAALAMLRDPAAPLIFVPERQRLLPPIDSFGGNIGQTLRLVLGRLFAETGGLAEDPGRRPVFVFSPGTEADFALDVEVLAQNSFRPLHLRLKWINDHMLVRSPRFVAEDRLEQLADDLYDGRIADELRAEAGLARDALQREWARVQAGIGAEIGRLSELLREEIALCAERLNQSHDFLGHARRRVALIDAEVNAARQQLLSHETGARDLRALPVEQADARQDFVIGLLAEMENGLRTIETAAGRIAEHRARIAELEQQVAQQR